MPRKKAPSKTGSTKINKSEWIRSQPSSMAAKEVLEKAAAEGIKLSLAQIYTARSSAKKAGGKGSPKGAKGPRKIAARSTRQSGGDELEFRRLVISIGLPAAEAYMSDLKRSVGL